MCLEFSNIFVYYPVRSVSGRTGGGDGVFLGELFESYFLGMLNSALLLHDSVFHSLLFRNHGTHSVVFLLKGFSK